MSTSPTDPTVAALEQAYAAFDLPRRIKVRRAIASPRPLSEVTTSLASVFSARLDAKEYDALMVLVCKIGGRAAFHLLNRLASIGPQTFALLSVQTGEPRWCARLIEPDSCHRVLCTGDLCPTKHRISLSPGNPDPALETLFVCSKCGATCSAMSRYNDDRHDWDGAAAHMVLPRIPGK